MSETPGKLSSAPGTPQTPNLNTSSNFRKDTNLPLAKVRTIMKSSPDVENVSQESLFLITKATELFIIYLTKLSQRNDNNMNEVNYGDLSAVVQRKESMEFLHDIVPKKVKYSEYLKMMENEKSDEDPELI